MRRRTATRQMPPPTPTQQQQQRIPQPSIKSSQVFSPQQRQYQQQMKGNQYSNSTDYGVENTSSPKMSLAQAITLITLRLGSVETKIMNGEIGSSVNLNRGENLQQFNERIDSLEEKINASLTNNYKHQIDQLAEAIIQSKHLSNSLLKENKELKNEWLTLKKQISDIKNSILETEQLAKNNENKIFQMLNSTTNVEFEDLDGETEEIEEIEEINHDEDSSFNENIESQLNEYDDESNLPI